MAADFAIVEPGDVPEEPFPESGMRHRKLTDALGCQHVRVNEVTLRPGEATAPHRHERQEEVYVSLDGGVVQIDDEEFEVTPGTVIRIGPPSLRRVRNGSDAAQSWLMFGAPPVGTVDTFGEYTMPEGP